MTEILNTAASHWWNWIWPMFWQSSLLILAVGLADFLLRRWTWPQVRYALYLLVLLKLLLPPSLSSPASLAGALFGGRSIERVALPPAIQIPPASPKMASQAPSFEEPAFETQPAPLLPPPQPTPPQLSWQACLMVVWFAGVVLLSSWVLLRFRALRRDYLGANPPPASPAAFDAMLCATASQLRLRRLPAVVFSSRVQSPAVFGVWRPVLVMPLEYRDRALNTSVPSVPSVPSTPPPADTPLRHVLLHELAHIKRGDLHAHALFILLQILYWLHPLLWLVRRRLQYLRELCCDATVAGVLREETAGYRETLLQTASRLLRPASRDGLGLLGLMEQPGNLLERLRQLEKKIWRHTRLRFLAVAVTVGVMFAAVLPMVKSQPKPTATEMEGSEKPAALPRIPAWHLLRQPNVGPVLSPLFVRLVQSLDADIQSGPVWQTGKAEKTQLNLDIRAEGKKRGKVMVGFFDRPDWRDRPRYVRVFPGPGTYALEDIPPGRYYLGAAMGNLDEQPWDPAGTYNIMGKAARSPEEPAGLGVQESWPESLDVTRDKPVSVSLLLSPEFGWAGGHIQAGTLLAWRGDWKEMRPERKITVRTLDESGKPVPFCKVTFVARGGNGEYTYHLDTGSDENGLAYCDAIDGPFSILIAERYDFRSETLAHLYQCKRMGAVYDSKEKPVIDIRLGAFPVGRGRIAGHVHDQDGNPVKGYFLFIEHAEGDRRIGTGDRYESQIQQPVVEPDGKFAVEGLAAGVFTARVLAFDHYAYAWSFDPMTTFTIPEKGEMPQGLQNIALEFEAKERLYVRALFEDGSPVYPGMWAAWFQKDHGPGGNYFADDIESDGSFRVCLSKKERAELTKNSGGLIEISTDIGNNDYRKIGTVRFDQLSKKPDQPSIIRFPRPSTKPEDAPSTAPGELTTEAANPLKAGPDDLLVRLVDGAGRPVAGAIVASSAQGDSEQTPIWRTYFLGSSLSNYSSDSQGGVMLRNAWAGGRKDLLLYAWQREQGLVGLVKVAKDSAGSDGTAITLSPACRIHGRFESSELKSLGRSLDWTNVYLYSGEDRPLSYQSKRQQFEFFVPAGKYTLRAYGTDLRNKSIEVTVPEGKQELDLSAIDLPAAQLAKLIGKEAPELQQIKGWKNTKPLRMADLRGQYVLLDFWGYWCGPCVRDFPHLMLIQEAFAGRGLTVLGIHDDSVDSIEQMDAKLSQTRERIWLGRDINFPVALDGGGKVKNKDTGQEANGATTSAWGIESFPTTVLVGPDGRVIEKFDAPSLDEKIARLERITGIQAAPPPWRKEFNKVYRLEEGEALRFVSPPFIPERNEFFFRQFARWGWFQSLPKTPQFPPAAVLAWKEKQQEADDGMIHGRLGFSDVLNHLGFEDREFEGNVKALERLIEGDWIKREGAGREELLAALQKAANEKMGLAIRFEPRTVEREVIIASGQFSFQPLGGLYGDRDIQLFTGKPDPADNINGGGGSGTLSGFLDFVAPLTGRNVVNTATPPSEDRLQWLQHSSAGRSVLAGDPARLDDLLKNVSRQTSLQFRLEKRRVKVWFVSEGADVGIARGSGNAPDSGGKLQPSTAEIEKESAKSGETGIPPKAVQEDNPLGLSDDVLKKLFETGQSMRQVLTAVQSYRIDHQRVPEKMEDLLKPVDYLGKVPSDPFGSEPLRLIVDPVKAPDKVRVYSVGPDGKWDDGKAINSSDSSLAGDLGAELDNKSRVVRFLADPTFTMHLEGKRLSHYLASKAEESAKPLPAAAPENISRTTTQTLVWGPEVDGLRAALELVPEQEAYTLGQVVGVRHHVRNVSRHPIQVATSDARQDEATFKDANGGTIAGRHPIFTRLGMDSIPRRTLQPGEIAVFKSFALGIGVAASEPKPGSTPAGNILDGPPGKYTVTYSLRFPGVRQTLARGRPQENVLQPEDWQGVLETGPRGITVKSAGKSSVVPKSNLPPNEDSENFRLFVAGPGVGKPGVYETPKTNTTYQRLMELAGVDVKQASDKGYEIRLLGLYRQGQTSISEDLIPMHERWKKADKGRPGAWETAGDRVFSTDSGNGKEDSGIRILWVGPPQDMERMQKAARSFRTGISPRKYGGEWPGQYDELLSLAEQAQKLGRWPGGESWLKDKSEDVIRERIHQLIEACAKNDEAAVRNLVKKGKLPPRDMIREMRESQAAGAKPGEIRSITISGDRALVVTQFFTIADKKYKDQQQCLIYTLERQGAEWRVFDIDMESVETLVEEVRRFQEEQGPPSGGEDALRWESGIKKILENQTVELSSFYDTYRLENSEILKRIAPPFIPQRADYYRRRNPTQAQAIPEPPDYFVFRWDGALEGWGMGFMGGNTPLSRTLGHCGLANFEFDGPADLLNLQVTGDWIIRKDTSREDLLKALEQIIKKDLNRDIRFVKRQVERTVVVASGVFSPGPRPSPEFRNNVPQIHIYLDQPDPELGRGGASGNLGEFLRAVGTILHAPVIDETKGDAVSIEWAQYSDVVDNNIAGDPVKIRKILDNLSKQTSLEFKSEKRPVEVWFVTEDDAKGQPVAAEVKKESPESLVKPGEQRTPAGVLAPEPENEIHRRVLEEVYILRHYVVLERADVWVGAIRKLTSLGGPAVPELVKELRRGGNPHSQSAIAYTLRAIGDRRAVPGLIRALAHASSGSGSDYGGITTTDPELDRFMTSHQRGTRSGNLGFDFGRSVTEITGTLEKLTGHSEGHEHQMYHNEKGKIPSVIREVTPRMEEDFALRLRQASGKWRIWWNANKAGLLNPAQLAEAESWTAPPLSDPVESAGLAAHGSLIPFGPTVSFGSVTEVTLAHATDGWNGDYLDFDSGKRLRIPQEIKEITGGQRIPRSNQWSRQNGVDVGTFWGWNLEGDKCIRLQNAHSCFVWPVDNARWETIEQEIRENHPPALGDPQSGFGNIEEKSKTPLTYLIRTREGGVGMVQLLGFNADMSGIRIRYKMLVKAEDAVQPASPDQPLTRSQSEAGEGKKENTESPATTRL